MSGAGLVQLSLEQVEFPMKRLIRAVEKLVSDDGGAIMVEWVALAAGLAVGAVVISFLVMKGLATPAANIANQLSGP